MSCIYTANVLFSEDIILVNLISMMLHSRPYSENSKYSCIHVCINYENIYKMHN